MKTSLLWQIAVFVITGLLIVIACTAAPYEVNGVTLDDETDYNYGLTVNRYSNGKIKRSSRVLGAFARIHPCPSTMQPLRTCPGWSINHVKPLACGWLDVVSNLQWLPDDIKSCAGSHCVDRFERKIGALNPPVPDTGACVNEIVQ